MPFVAQIQVWEALVSKTDLNEPEEGIDDYQRDVIMRQLFVNTAPRIS